MNEVIKQKIRDSTLYGFAGKYVFQLRNRIFDWKHNIETARDVKLSDLEIDQPNAEFGVMYAGTDPKSFVKLFDNWNIPFENFCFVDLGSGKGRVLLMASAYPFKKITGVEFARELNEIARNNIKNYRNPQQKCSNIEALCLDASAFEIPVEPLIVYIFNPFKAEIVGKVVKNLEKSLIENPRQIYFVYAYSVHGHLLEASEYFEKNYSDEWYTIYKSCSK